MGRPRVRAVVVNFNGEAFIERSVEALLATTAGAELEVVVVDNASTDASRDVLQSLQDPRLSVVESQTNLGFAAGTNLGIGHLGGVDHVAFVNSDAFVEPDWLDPLLEALAAGTRTGAVCPKLLFEPRFVEVSIETTGFVPGNGDPRLLGVMVAGVRGGRFGLRSARFAGGFYHEEPGGPAGRFRWSSPTATLFAPVERDTAHVELLLVAPRPQPVELACARTSETVDVGPEPTWVSLPVDGADAFDVVNNAGSKLFPGGHGGDRGFGEPDRGQFDDAGEVFAWCGAAAVMKREYLEDVGRLDPSYFLYYEDTDLAWRGRSRGWSYTYVPDAVVRHMHTASTVENSELFNHFVQRNRLLTLVKNAPARFAARQCADFFRELSRETRDEVVRPRLQRRPGDTSRLRPRARAGGGFAERLPAALLARRAIDRRRTVPAQDVLDTWLVEAA